MTKKTKPDIWFPFYIGDYLGDTMHFGLEHHGAYFLLLLAQWRSGEIPQDAAGQAAICKISTKRWLTIAPKVLSKFQIVDGILVQKRMHLERQKAYGNISKPKPLRQKPPSAAEAKPPFRRGSKTPFRRVRG